MSDFDINTFEDDLDIHTESAWHFEQDVKNHAKLHGRYAKWQADANKRLTQLEFEKEMLIATIVDEHLQQSITNGKEIAIYNLREIKNYKVPLDPRYKDLMRRYVKAKEISETLNGLSFAWSARGRNIEKLSYSMNTRATDTDFTAGVATGASSENKTAVSGGRITKKTLDKTEVDSPE